jgi:DNA-binding transcriptional regulator GbsR (MarR family)
MNGTGIDAARWEMMEAGGRTAQAFGLTRLFGRLYVLIYLHSDPLCLDDLAGHLGVSKASVSIACRQLASWGAVRCVARPGDRRDYYVAETNLRKVVHGGLLASLNKKLDSAQKQIERSLRMLDAGEEDAGRTGPLRQRLQEAEQIRARLSKLLNNPLLRRLL